MTVEVVVSKCTCLRCGHWWYPRKPGRPNTCSHCRSPLWDQPYQRPPAKPAARSPRAGDHPTASSRR